MSTKQKKSKDLLLVLLRDSFRRDHLKNEGKEKFLSNFKTSQCICDKFENFYQQKNMSRKERDKFRKHLCSCSYCWKEAEKYIKEKKEK